MTTSLAESLGNRLRRNLFGDELGACDAGQLGSLQGRPRE
jgi:hypothetical protein